MGEIDAAHGLRRPVIFPMLRIGSGKTREQRGIWLESEWVFD